MATEKKLEIGMLPDVDNISWLKPNGASVIIKPSARYELKSKGGVYLPDTHAETMRNTTLSKGEIVTVGKDCANPDTKVGNQIYFFWPEGQGMFKCEDTIYLLFPEYSIKAYLCEPPLVVDETGELAEKDLESK